VGNGARVLLTDSGGIHSAEGMPPGHELCISCRHQHRGRDSGVCLLRKPVAECVVAEEEHEANFAIETL
jgi:hypothetical protein